MKEKKKKKKTVNEKQKNNKIKEFFLNFWAFEETTRAELFEDYWEYFFVASNFQLQIQINK